MAQAQTESRHELAEKIGRDILGQGLMASIILTLFYVLVQILGFFMSAHHAFFQNGKKAYEQTRGCHSYEELLEKHFEPYAKRANKRLGDLRLKFAKANINYREIIPTTTFEEFYFLSRSASKKAFNAMALAKEIDAINDKDEKKARLESEYAQSPRNSGKH